MTVSYDPEWLLINPVLSNGEKPVTGIQYIDDLLDGNYADVLTSPTASDFFTPPSSVDLKYETNGHLDIAAYTRTIVQKHLAKADQDPKELRLQIVAIAVACFNAFMQLSWTGPNLDIDIDSIINARLQSNLAFLTKDALGFLTEDSEEPYHLSPQPLLLALSKALLVDQCGSLLPLKTVNWWALRVLSVQQRILDNPAASVLNLLLEKENMVLKDLELFEGLNDEWIRELRARFFLEAGFVYHFHGRDKLALENFTKAQESTGFKWSLTGALGKRTKFQTFDVAQLVVIAESASEESSKTIIPETLALNDDTLLESIAFTEEDGKATIESKQGKLKTIDQCTLLAFCLNVKNTNPADGITSEQMLPYVTRVLDNPNNWMVHTMGLLLRSRLESNKGRTVERSVLQLQALVDQMPCQDSTVSERMQYLAATLIPSKWDMEKELGERLVSLGVVRSALEIFERLQLWEDAIACHQMLDNEKQAESIIRQQLEINPDSPKFYCLLGDIKKDPEYYYKAWKLSNGRYARAMRALGGYYFAQGEFTKSIDCYSKAMAINPLFENSWFVMGCAAIRAEDWENAQDAFLRVVNLNHDNGEAWTNLASVYVKIDRKRDAWRALKEGLRQHHDNSRIWENYLFTSIDLGEFAEVIRAMSRILEIRSNPLRSSSSDGSKNLVDMGCLKILVNAVIEGTPASDGTPASTLDKKLSTLLTALTEKISNSPRLYELCSEFQASKGHFKAALDYLLKAYRVYLNSPNLTTEESTFKEAAESLRRLVGGYKLYGPKEDVVRAGAEGETAPVCPDWKYQSRMALRTFIGRTKDSFEDTPDHDSLKELLKEF
ncbi:hypothetical protein HDV05_008431 [Chytridiales sp. JEL 0842]|nr:hypothetical protein HDV05_008431 [Chytridiales sp. JEL 0842]